MDASHDFFKQALEDIFAYAKHSKRKIADEKDCEILLKRQKKLQAQQSITSMARKWLSRELTDELL